ncbi:BMP family lipoprotein [Anaerosalibacter sp. Marseille-P3206]|uniref:BMP family lipoprotein n=1 Tax=Anaerosalibacter sp. Marseille-P3206 TaxID=1871005 RepID=UPI0009879D7E|nr:BMP family ABC transporter substrate-binding protein [Anaerosalibacter sp. Marseille-P3206]
MSKKIIAVLMIAVLAFSLVACTDSGKSDEGKTDEGKVESDLKVAMVTDVGGVNDQSFNQSAWEGLQQAEKDFGVKVSYQESHQDADFVPNLETLVDAENDMIWGIGFKLGDAIKEAAEKNPDTKYGIVDFSYGDKTPENVVGVVFKAEQPSFLVGYIAAKMTETGTVGFVGGMEGDVIWGFDYGFHAGVAYANKVNGTDVKVLRQYAESFNDAAKGKAITNSMYQQGADIVFHAAGGVGDGVIEAAKEQGKWAIGVDRDQNYMAPDNVLTSAMKRVDQGIYLIVKDLADGKFTGGETVVLGLKEGAVDIAPTSDKHVPKEILDEVEGLKKDIIDEKIVVPVNEKTFEEYLETLE